MAGDTITRGEPRGHLRLVFTAGVACLSTGAVAASAQDIRAGLSLPFCPVYAPGQAPAIGPSNCVPVPQALLQAPATDTGVAPDAKPAGAATPPRPLALASPVAPSRQASASPSPPPPPSPQSPVVLRTPGAITLEQIATLLAPLSKRTVAFTLSPADEYKKSDLTHRVTLTWSGPLQALVDQLAGIYGLDAAIDETAIRFSTRPSGATGASTASPSFRDRS